MKFELLGTASPTLQQQLQWIWFSRSMASFIVGDERNAFAIADSSATAATSLTAARPFDPNSASQHPCNLPIPDELYSEFAQQPWHGFRFLGCSAYDRANDNDGHPIGDLLRTLVFGPSYGHYVLHPASAMVLSLRSGSIELFRNTPEGFVAVDQTRTRGKASLAFAGHPTEPLIAYGDNAGTFHAQRFDESGFGKAAKIVTKERKASRLEFSADGTSLMLGGMGYLTSLAYEKSKFTVRHEISIAVKDFVWDEASGHVFVNQGLHGVSVFKYSEAGFVKVGEIKPVGGVQQMSVSDDAKHLAVTSPGVGHDQYLSNHVIDRPPSRRMICPVM